MSEHLLRLGVIAIASLIAAVLVVPVPSVPVALTAVFLVAVAAYVMGLMSGKAAIGRANPPAETPDAPPDSP